MTNEEIIDDFIKSNELENLKRPLDDYEYCKRVMDLARQDEREKINAETEKLIEDISREKEQWKFTANMLAGTNEKLEKELSEAKAEIERLKQ